MPRLTAAQLIGARRAPDETAQLFRDRDARQRSDTRTEAGMSVTM